MTVVYKLWQSSWRRDVVRLNRSTNTFTDPSLVREINHKDIYFDVPGPHICSPSPQRRLWLAEYICVGGLGFTPVGTPASVVCGG